MLYFETMKGDELTAKQKLFIDYYIALKFNATEAALKAGYSKNSINKSASALVNTPKIKAEISKRLNDILSNTSALTREWLEQVRNATMFDPRNILDWGGESVNLKESVELDLKDARMITEISCTTTKDGGTTKLKFVSKEKAFELLGKYLAILSDNPPPPVDTAESMDEKTIRERIAYLELRRGKTDAG